MLIWIYLSAFLISCLSTYLLIIHLKKCLPSKDIAYTLLPISILKPIKGVDYALEKNLISFFNIQYPEFEILFSLENPNDPAIAVIQKLMDINSHINSKIIIQPQFLGHNPKVNNLATAYDISKYDLVLISDANVRVPSNYLSTLVSQMDNSTGIATAVVRGSSMDGFASQLEGNILNSFYAKAMILAKSLKRPCVVGKTMLFRKSIASRFGGIQILGHLIAEDYMAGEAFRHLGYEVKLVRDPIEQPIGPITFKHFWSRHIRWGRIRKSQSPLLFYVEPIFSTTVTSVLISLQSGIEFFLPLFILASIPNFIACLYMNQFKLRSSLYGFLIEFILPILWFNIAIGNHVHWRGRDLKLIRGGVLR